LIQHRRSAAAAAWALVVGLLAMYLALFALGALGRLVRPLDEFTYGESWLLDGARQVALGHGLYQPPDQLPLMHIAYTPLYYLVVGALQRLDADSTYTTGRVVSLVGTLIGAAAIVWALRCLTARWWVGLLAAAFFLTQNVTALLWAPLHRVDPLALGLTLLGLALVTAGRVSLAAIVFVLALLTKQTYFVAPLAAAISLWPYRGKLLRFSAVLIGGSLLAVVVAEVLTRGWFLWHTVVANGNEPDLLTFAALMGSFLQFNGLTVLAALASFALPATSGERLWRYYFLGCLLTLPSLAKLGASSNYWLELSAASAVLLALATFRLSFIPAARLVAPTILAGALLVALTAYQATAVDLAYNFSDLLHPTSPEYLSLVGDGDNWQAIRVDTRFVEQVAAEPGDLLTDNSGLAVAAGKPIEFEFQIFQLLYTEGYWSDQPIVDAVKAHRFSLVALMHPLDGPIDGTRWTPALQAALNEAYEPAGQQAGFWLYRPRS
jgi:hypothetical protein